MRDGLSHSSDQTAQETIATPPTIATFSINGLAAALFVPLPWPL
jgi:hypothetical protein